MIQLIQVYIYIEYLLNGNGLLAKRVGGRSDMGADILVYNPKTPDRVDTIIQTKNHSNKLSFDDTKIELIKFEDKKQSGGWPPFDHSKKNVEQSGGGSWSLRN